MIYNKFILLFIFFTGLFSQDKGQKFFKEKKYNEARKYYESVLEHRDDDKAAMFGLGSSAYYQNEIEAALNSFGNTIDTENKALRSKSYYNPHVSDKLSVLRYSVPEFIRTDENLNSKIKRISKAEIKDGGDGAIYIFLKNNINL